MKTARLAYTPQYEVKITQWRKTPRRKASILTIVASEYFRAYSGPWAEWAWRHCIKGKLHAPNWPYSRVAPQFSQGQLELLFHDQPALP